MTSVRHRILKLERKVQYVQHRRDSEDISRQRDAQDTVAANPGIRLVMREDTDPWIHCHMAAIVADADGDFDLADQILAARPPYPGELALKAASTREEKREAGLAVAKGIARRAMTWEQDWDNAITKARERLGLPWEPPARRERHDGLGGDDWDR